MFNGILLSVVLETFVLLRQMAFTHALRTALGMSMISMLAMEIAMNLTDIYISFKKKIYIIRLNPNCFFYGYMYIIRYNTFRIPRRIFI